MSNKLFEVMYSPCGCCEERLFPYTVKNEEDAKVVFNRVKNQYKLKDVDFEASYLVEVTNE